MTKQFPIEISVSAGACITGCLFILLVPLDFTVSFFLAAEIHEVGHLLMLLLFRVPVWCICFETGGASIQTDPLEPKEELFCAAAGPVASFLCLLLLRRFPLLGICALIQGSFNLLPIYPMDGGRVFRCCCLLLCPRYEASICKAVEIACIAIIFGLCILLFFRSSAPVSLCIACYFLIQTIKTPCKEPQD